MSLSFSFIQPWAIKFSMDLTNENWSNITNLGELSFTDGSMSEIYKWKTTESLSKKMGAENLGFHVEILAPGKFSCPYHFHHLEEELFLVLEGHAILRQDGRFRKVSTGDLIFFKNGPKSFGSDAGSCSNEKNGKG